MDALRDNVSLSKIPGGKEMEDAFESFCFGVFLCFTILFCMFMFLIRPSYVYHAIHCGTASYNETTGKLMWHDCAAAPEPSPIPLEEVE